jgi:acetylornithine deacetylase/succinyl-diaminopimelate desuccinylase-like protein
MMKAFVTEICEAVGPRLSGSPQEAQAAQLIAQRLKPVSDEVSVEEVPMHIGVSAALTTLLVAGVCLAAIVYWFVPLLAALLIAATLTILYLSRPMGKDVIDPLFPKGSTQNVVAKLYPTGETRERVIFSGHHDSNVRMPLLNPPWKRHAYTIQQVATFGTIWLALLSLAKAAAQFAGWSFLWVGPGRWAAGDWLILPGLVAAGAAILMRQLTVTHTPVIGAGDNLTAVAVVLRLMEILSAQRPQHTEVWGVSFGAEEVGAKGSRAFATDRASELEGTYVVNLETLGAGQLAIIEREGSVMSQHAPQVVDLLQGAGQRVGIDLPAVTITMGDTDATSFSRLGLWAATLFGMDETGLFVHWHTLEDNVENVSPDHLQRALDVCLAVVAELEDSAEG